MDAMQRHRDSSSMSHAMLPGHRPVLTIASYDIIQRTPQWLLACRKSGTLFFSYCSKVPATDCSGIAHLPSRLINIITEQIFVSTYVTFAASWGAPCVFRHSVCRTQTNIMLRPLSFRLQGQLRPRSSNINRTEDVPDCSGHQRRYTLSHRLVSARCGHRL